eukprot:5502765-Prymnesium_polylepis.1
MSTKRLPRWLRARPSPCEIRRLPRPRCRPARSASARGPRRGRLSSCSGRCGWKRQPTHGW